MDEDRKNTNKLIRDAQDMIDRMLKVTGKESVFNNKHDHDVDPIAPFCSFCENGSNQVLQMIEGNQGAFICDKCITMFYEFSVKRGKDFSNPESRFQNDHKNEPNPPPKSNPP